MTTHPTIPRGWRRLRKNEKWKLGDDVIISPCRWNKTRGAWIQKLTLIRRVAKKKGRK